MAFLRSDHCRLFAYKEKSNKMTLALSIVVAAAAVADITAERLLATAVAFLSSTRQKVNVGRYRCFYYYFFFLLIFLVFIYKFFVRSVSGISSNAASHIHLKCGEACICDVC